MARPLIAINGLALVEPKPGVRLDDQYSRAVTRAGGLPMVVPPTLVEADLRELLGRVDGVLFTGGDDFDTDHLGLEPTHPSATPTPLAKQDFDFLLLRLALEAGVPVLGICYGMQLMGLHHGAPFHQHVPEARPGAQEHSGGVLHPVQLTEGSKLRTAMGVEEVTVVSRHHQALAAAPEGWICAAEDHEGLVEAIEHPSHRFLVGVQWHPELSPPESPHGALLEAFIEAATSPQLRSTNA